MALLSCCFLHHSNQMIIQNSVKDLRWSFSQKLSTAKVAIYGATWPVFKETSHISAGSCPSSEKSSYIWGNGLSRPNIENFLIFEEGTCKA